MSLAADVVSAVLLLSGGLLSLLAAVGLLRFPDALARLQAATKPTVLGLAFIVLGVMPAVWEDEQAPALVLVILFQLATAPVVAQLVGRAAHRAGAVRPDLLVVDDVFAEVVTGSPDDGSAEHGPGEPGPADGGPETGDTDPRPRG